MGYTHYWTLKKSSAKKFKDFSDTCKILHDNLPEKSNTAGGYFADEKISIGDWDGHLGLGKAPEFSKDLVNFNGVGELQHETFNIEFDQNGWSFCKTARKPYDLLVCACLLAASNILGYDISSDGNLKDWKPAMEYYNEVINKTNDKRSFIINCKITDTYMKKFKIV